MILEVENYSIAFDRQIMEEVTFSMEAGGKVAIVGPNGTERQPFCVIFKNNNPASKLAQTLKLPIFPRCMGKFLTRKRRF